MISTTTRLTRSTRARGRVRWLLLLCCGFFCAGFSGVVGFAQKGVLPQKVVPLPNAAVAPKGVPQVAGKIVPAPQVYSPSALYAPAFDPVAAPATTPVQVAAKPGSIPVQTVASNVVTCGPGPTAASLTNMAFSCAVNPSQRLFSANTKTTAVLQVVVNAPNMSNPLNRPAVNLCLVLDGSGSMKGSKLDQAKQAAVNALQQLGPQDWFSVIVLGKRVETLVPSQAVTQQAAIEAKIRSITADGGTSLFGGLSRAATEVRRNMDEAFVHRIVVLSDGAANEGPSSARLLERLGLSLLKENISVSTIGIGESFNEDLLTRLADKSDGNFHFAEREAQLTDILKTEMDELLQVVAQDVDLNVECLGGVTPVKVLGRNGFISDNYVNIPMNQLYAGDNTALIEVVLPPNAASATTTIANAWADFRNGLTRRVERLDAQSQVGFSTDITAVQSSEVPAVQKAAYLTNAGLAQEQALQYYAVGNAKDAWTVLNKNSDALERAGSRYQDKELQQQSLQLRQVEEQVEQNALNNIQQKQMRNDSYNLKRSNNRAGY